MLNLPFLAPQPAQTAAAAPRKSADARQENDGFSDVYDDMNSADDRPSDDLAEAREARSDSAEDNSVESDSSASQKKASTEDTAPDSADFAAVDAAAKSDAEAEQPVQADEKRAAVNASENAAMMRMAPQAQTQAQAQSQAQAAAQAKAAQADATNAQTQAQTGAPVLKQTAAEAAAAQKTPEPSQASAVQAAKLATETAEGLDPMQVEVRSKTAPQAANATANAAATAAQKAFSATPTQEATLRPAAQAEVEADPAQEPTLAKTDAPTAPTISTTQQMQARAIMEQVQAGIQPVTSKKAENNALSSGESVLPAALEESSLTSRAVMSTQEAASQARLLNSAPNPAYVVRQIAEAANKASDKNMIELTMDPPELGKVRMSMAESGGVMAVTISADSQATTELMRRHMDLLRKDFMEMGYQDVSFSFEQGGSDGSSQQAQMNNDFGQGDGGQGDSPRGETAPADASAILAAQQTSQLSTASSGVDIRI